MGDDCCDDWLEPDEAFESAVPTSHPHRFAGAKLSNGLNPPEPTAAAAAAAVAAGCFHHCGTLWPGF